MARCATLFLVGEADPPLRDDVRANKKVSHATQLNNPDMLYR
jgi:hypothetical protein